MPYLVIAAQQLMKDVEAIHPGAKVTVVDDLDGFGWNRSIRVEGEAAKELGDALAAIADHEPRIAEVVKSSKGVRVTMVESTLADHDDPFPLAETLAVLNED